MQITTTDIILRVIFSLLLGFIIGLERESKRKPAGLRTNMMVALGSATFTILTLELFNDVLQVRDRLKVGHFRLAMITTVLAFLVLTALRFLEKQLPAKDITGTTNG